jgi:hypothetical protein
MHPAFLESTVVLLVSVLRDGTLFARKAYLDPGSGSYILQILLGALLGAAFIIRVYWRKIKSFFRRQPAAEEEEGTDEE